MEALSSRSAALLIMSAKMRAWVSAGLVLVTVAGIFDACGDGEGDGELSLEQYFKRVETAQRRAEQRAADAASQEFDLPDWLANRVDITRDFLHDINQGGTPAEVEVEHRAYADALDNLNAHTDDLLRRVADAKSESEQTAIREEWLDNPIGNELEDRVRVACSVLQQSANSRQIDVNLCYEPRGP